MPPGYCHYGPGQRFISIKVAFEFRHKRVKKKKKERVKIEKPPTQIMFFKRGKITFKHRVSLNMHQTGRWLGSPLWSTDNIRSVHLTVATKVVIHPEILLEKQKNPLRLIFWGVEFLVQNSIFLHSSEGFNSQRTNVINYHYFLPCSQRGGWRS